MSGTSPFFLVQPSTDTLAAHLLPHHRRGVMLAQIDQQAARLRHVNDVMAQEPEVSEQREKFSCIVGFVEAVELPSVARVARRRACDGLSGSGFRRNAFLEPRIGGTDALAFCRRRGAATHHDGVQARAVTRTQSNLGAIGAAKPMADHHVRRARNRKGEALQHPRDGRIEDRGMSWSYADQHRRDGKSSEQDCLRNPALGALALG